MIASSFVADGHDSVAARPRGSSARHRACHGRTAALLLLLPLAVFLAFFHVAMLRIDNVGWLLAGTDNGENALGAHAYWHDATSGASLRTTLLNAPDGVPVLYTDSNPLLTLAAKPLAHLMSADAQLVGPYILLCLILQAVFAWLILRRRAPGAIALWSGVALLAFPPTLLHRYIHVNLMAHWTILAALWLFLDKRRAAKLAWWAPVIAVTALTHSYLLFMVAAIWGSAMLARFADGDRRERLAVAGQIVVILAMVALLARWLGVGDQMPTATFGAFRMPIDALWNPRIAAYQTLLPGYDPGSRKWFEGFQYLGAGGLLLVAGAVWIARRYSADEDGDETLRRLRRLAPALIVLTILAVAQLPLPNIAMAVLDPVRASGRLFWPVGYVLVLVALLAVFRLPPRSAGLLLAAIVSVQVIDLAGMASFVRARNAAAEDRRPYRITRDPRWDALVNDARSVAFYPADVTIDLDLFQEVAWRSTSAGKPVSNVYAARVSRASALRAANEDAAFTRGDLLPGRLYIVAPGTSIPAALSGRTSLMDGVTIVRPRG